VEDRCTGSANVLQAKKLFSMHPMEFLDDEAQVEAHFGRLEIVLILTQCICTVYAEHTIGSEIVLDGPNGTPR
jgi:hypothetical protein